MISGVRNSGQVLGFPVVATRPSVKYSVYFSSKTKCGKSSSLTLSFPFD